MRSIFLSSKTSLIWLIINLENSVMGRGGARPGSGRKPGKGRWKGLEVKIVKLPVICADIVQKIVEQQIFENPEPERNLAQFLSTLRGKLTKPMLVQDEAMSQSSQPIKMFWGKVAATPGLTATDNEIVDEINIFEFLIKNPSKTFIFRVSGDSMIDAKIHENDLVIVEAIFKYPFEQPEHGDIVVASVGNEVVVKRFQKQNGKVMLVSENKEKNYAPILVEDDTPFTPIGIVQSSITPIAKSFS